MLAARCRPGRHAGARRQFTGAADELAGAFLVNPHDIEGMKNAIVRAATATTPAEARRRMRAMRKRVRAARRGPLAATFLYSLRGGTNPASAADGTDLAS